MQLPWQIRRLTSDLSCRRLYLSLEDRAEDRASVNGPWAVLLAVDGRIEVEVKALLGIGRIEPGAPRAHAQLLLAAGARPHLREPLTTLPNPI